jgi:hypothetical protein
MHCSTRYEAALCSRSANGDISCSAQCYGIAEIPKMLKQRLYRKLWAFSILLAAGTILTVLKSLDVDIHNPSDFIAWLYSQLAETMKNMTK